MRVTTNDLKIQPSVSGGAIIQFDTLDIKYQPELMHKYDGKELTIEIKQKRKGRSLDANAYCWLLCSKIADTHGLLLKKTDVYKQAIRDYGVTAVMPIKNDLLGDIIDWHRNGGLGNDADVIGASKVKGYTNVMFYYGSSGYDSKQMSHLLTNLVADAQELGIQTETPDEIERMKQQWGV